MLWQTENNVLRLTDLCLDVDLVGATIEFVFPATLLPTVTVVEQTSGPAYSFYVFVMTAGATVHRLIFPHPLATDLFGRESVFAYVDAGSVGLLHEDNHVDLTR